jgi:hypothetical protein
MVNLVGQGYSNYLKGEMKFDFLSFGGDLLNPGWSHAIWAGFDYGGEIGYDLNKNDIYTEFNKPAVGFAKAYKGLVFGAIGDGIGSFFGTIGRLASESGAKLMEEYSNVQAENVYPKK